MNSAKGHVVAMRMTEQDFGDGAPPIDGYAPGGFRIRGVFIEGAVLLSPEGVTPWRLDKRTLEPDAFEQVLELAGRVDVVLIGMGLRIQPLPGMAQARFDSAGLGVEPMSTPSACRSYNVLLSEGRRVAAALIPLVP